MRQIDIQGFLNRNKYNEAKLYVKGFDYALESMVQRFFRGQESQIPLIIRFFPVEGNFITDEQRGYIFGHLGNLAFDYLKANGYGVKSVHEAIDIMKINENIRFTEQIIDYNTGVVQEIPLSLATSSPDKEEWASRELVSQFIDKLYLFLINAGMKPQSPAQYHRKKRWVSL